MDRVLRCQTALTRLCGCELAALKLSDFVVQLNISLLILSFPTVTQRFFVARMLGGVNRGERHSLIGEP